MNKVSASSLDSSARLFKACSDPVRLRLLNLLEGREVCVCHLHDALELPQPTVSRHLAYLRKCGLVVGRKDGLWVHYRLAKPAGELHRRLLECVASVADFQTAESDRKRLDRLICC